MKQYFCNTCGLVETTANENKDDFCPKCNSDNWLEIGDNILNKENEVVHPEEVVGFLQGLKGNYIETDEGNAYGPKKTQFIDTFIKK